MTDLISRPTFTCLTCGTVHYSSDAYITCRDSHPPPSLVDRLRFGSIDDDLLDAAKEAADEIERLRTELANVNNEFGSQTADWPDAWKRVADLKQLSNDRWRENEKLRAALELAVSAFELGCDALRSEADRYHVEMKGYRPERHQMAEDDYTRAEVAWKTVREAMKETP